MAGAVVRLQTYTHQFGATVCMGFRREPGALIGADDLEGSSGAMAVLRDGRAAQGGEARGLTGGPPDGTVSGSEAITCRAGARPYRPPFSAQPW